jgi:hypothetical protein
MSCCCFLCQELELRIETQKQTLQQRDESIKKLLEMLQSKGEGQFIDIYELILVSQHNQISVYFCEHADEKSCLRADLHEQRK